MLKISAHSAAGSDERVRRRRRRRRDATECREDDMVTAASIPSGLVGRSGMKRKSVVLPRRINESEDAPLFCERYDDSRRVEQDVMGDIRA